MMNGLVLDRVARDGLYKVRPRQAAEIFRDAFKEGNLMDASSFVTVATAGRESSDASMRPHKRSCHGWDEAGTDWSRSQQQQAGAGLDHLQQCQDIEWLLREREINRRKREWVMADKIRDRLLALGVECWDKSKKWFSSDGRTGVMPTWESLPAAEEESAASAAHASSAPAEEYDTACLRDASPPPPPRLPAQAEGEKPCKASGTELNTWNWKENLVLVLVGLPWKAGPAEVCEFLQDYGVQEPQVKILYRQNGIPDGMALVTFASSELAARALEERQRKHLWDRYIKLRPFYAKGRRDDA